MLSQRFNAKEAAIVATQAAETLDAIDAIIEKAILDGHMEASILIYNTNSIPNGDYTKIGKVFREAIDFFINHYQRRGFIIKYENRYLNISLP